MKVRVNFFKPSGKFYADETIEIGEGTYGWDLAFFLPNDRLLDLVAVTEGPTPWGYPSMVPADAVRGLPL